jgi:hypothetical protein
VIYHVNLKKCINNLLKMNNNDNYTIDILKKMFKLHAKYIRIIKKIKENNNIKIRLPCIPEHISENLIKFMVYKSEKIKCNWNCKGDLITNKYIIECKCITSDGPISFGPCEKWNFLYVLDGRKWIETGIFKLYKINLTNDSHEWKNIKVNKTQTFSDQCKQKRRPRIKWNALKKQIKMHIVRIFKGTIDDI